MERLEQSCDQAINRSTDWTEVYCRFLALSIGDPLFHAQKFGRLPVQFLKTCLRHLVEAHQERVNADSVATAKLAMLVYSAIGGKTGKAKISDFLPYETKKEDGGLNQNTISAIQWALKHHKMPPSIIGLLGAELG